MGKFLVNASIERNGPVPDRMIDAIYAKSGQKSGERQQLEEDSTNSGVLEMVPSNTPWLCVHRFQVVNKDGIVLKSSVEKKIREDEIQCESMQVKVHSIMGISLLCVTLL